MVARGDISRPVSPQGTKSFISDIKPPNAPRAPSQGDEPPGAYEDYEEEEPADLGLPEAKIKTSRPSAGKASSKELSIAFQTNLLIVTSMLALLVSFPDIAMSEMEAQTIAIPAANLFESTDMNRRIGKMIAGSGDYSLLGYAIYLYLFRVVAAQRERNPRVRHQKATSPQPAATGGAIPTPISAAYGGVGATGTVAANGASMPNRPTGIRGFTPPS